MTDRTTIIRIHALFMTSWGQNRFHTGKEQVDLWVELLQDIDDKSLMEASKDLTSSPGQWPPTIGELRHRATEISMGLLATPSAVEAWERVLDLIKGEAIQLHDDEKRALKFVGGTWAVKNSERPDVLRSQFLKAYNEYITKKIIQGRSHASTKALAENNAPQLPPPPEPRQNGVEQCLSCDKWFPPSALYNGCCYNCQPPGNISQGSEEYRERVSSLLDLVPGYREQYPRF